MLEATPTFKRKWCSRHPNAWVSATDKGKGVFTPTSIEKLACPTTPKGIVTGAIVVPVTSASKEGCPS